MVILGTLWSRTTLLYLNWKINNNISFVLDHPRFKPDTEKPVIENEEFSIYYTARFGDHELLYGAQIDGMLATNGQVSDPPDTTDPETNINYLRYNEFIELKTNRVIEYRRQENNFKYVNISSTSIMRPLFYSE